MKFLLLLAVLLFVASSLDATAATWYVRSDGGTRHSAKEPKGQCDGAVDAAYPGHGVNQHCAFKDVRYLWTDGTYTTSVAPSAFPSWGWVGNGGDTYIIRGGPWRVGQSGPTPKDGFGLFGDPFGSGAPSPPSGSPGKPTRILGEHYENCSETNKTQLFGGYGVSVLLNLGSAYVEVECLELTRHSDCIQFGLPNPKPCNRDYPLSDYATVGIVTDRNTHDLLLQDLWIHGFTSRGVMGVIGGQVTAQRVTISYNGGAGWDFDDGKSTPIPNGSLKLDHTIIEWNGCNQTYPGSGALACYSQETGGYGDGVATPSHTCLSADVENSIFRYNTQDGFDLLHVDMGDCPLTIANSVAYGNNGAQFKWGAHNDPVNFTNNTVIGNCMRLSAPMAGQAAGYNQHLGDFCRALDTISINLRAKGSVKFTGNSIVSYAPTTIDIGCEGDCSTSTFDFKGNIILGLENPRTFKNGGQPGGPGVFYYGHPIGHVLRSDNVYSGVRGLKCPTGFSREICHDPGFVGEPRFSSEPDLDNFNFHLSNSSPMHVGAKEN